MLKAPGGGGAAIYRQISRGTLQGWPAGVGKGDNGLTQREGLLRPGPLAKPLFPSADKSPGCKKFFLKFLLDCLSLSCSMQNLLLWLEA